MSYMKEKYFTAVKNYFTAILENEDDVKIISEVLDMKIHHENGGEFMSNIKSDIINRGVSSETIELFNSFAENWQITVNSHFKYIPQNLLFQDFLDEIHVNY